MARRCDFLSKDVLVGNNVSHANNKTKRRFLPNLHQVSLYSVSLDRKFRFRICTNALRSVDKQGGLDEFLLNDKNESALSQKARHVRFLLILSAFEKTHATREEDTAKEPAA